MVVSHGANFVLGELDARLDGPAVLARCRARGLYLRALPSVSPRTFRVAVKASETNRRIVAILSGALQEEAGLP
jgi:histidinol-phosphate/aromatic aminotransferase/cobyric acid decarboxylase-like protein